MEKTIVGYKLKDLKYKNAAIAITGQRFFIGDKYDYSIKETINDLKEAGVLDLWFTPVYKEPELEVGKWYKKDNSISFYQGEGVETYGINHTLNEGWIVSKNWFAEWNGNLKNNTLATDKEVESALIKEAKKRGFKEGVFFKSIDNNSIEIKFKGDGFNVYMEERRNKIFSNSGYGLIFNNGKWATIVSKPETIELKDGYVAEIEEGFVKIGCIKLDFKEIKKLYKAIKKSKQ